MAHRLITALAAALALCAGPVAAQQYPAKPVRLVIGFAPGGGTDIVGRLLALKLSDALGQQFVVENKPGATGMIGAKQVASAPPDGYMILMGHVNSQAIAPGLMERPLYDPIKDFAPISYIGFVPNVLVVNPALGPRSVAELVALARSRPKGLSFASPGVGSTNHLAGEMLRMESGAQFVHVPYKGSSPAIVDLLGGQVDMNFDAMSSITAHLKAGKMVPLAVTTPQRDPDLPDVPTMIELGYKSLNVTNWYGMVAPAGTPPEIVNKLHGELQRIMQMPDVIAKLTELGVRREAMSVDRFRQFIATELAKYRDVAKRTGVRME